MPLNFPGDLPAHSQATLRRAVMTDLRTDETLLEILDFVTEADDAASRIYTTRTAPDADEAPPCYLVVDVYPSGGSGGGKYFSDTSYVVEAGWTDTHGWRERMNDRAGMNADTAVDLAMSAVELRAQLAFAIPHLDPNGNFGGGSASAPDDSGRMSTVQQWQYSLGRRLPTPM